MKYVWWTLGILVALILLAPFVPFLELFVILPLGWIRFLIRVLPQVTFNPALAIQTIVLATFAVGLTHWLLGWLYRAVQSDETETEQPWRWKWTFSSLTIVMLAFVVGISMVSIVHQSYWLTRHEEPWYVHPTFLRRSESRSETHLRGHSAALVEYEKQNGCLPPGGTLDERGEPQHGWAALILPFLDEAPSDMPPIDYEKPWRHEVNREAMTTHVNVFTNPSLENREWGKDYAPIHYSANGRVMGATPMRGEEITDGKANTILLGEVNHDFKPWGHPLNWRDPAVGLHTPGGFGSNPKLRTTQFLMADGSVRPIENDVDAEVLRALSTPRGGERHEE
jgi:hypothetical protein